MTKNENCVANPIQCAEECISDLEKCVSLKNLALSCFLGVKLFKRPFYPHNSDNAPATISETRSIAIFCHKPKLPAKKAKKSKMKASQPTPIIKVPAALEPSEFMVQVSL